MKLKLWNRTNFRHPTDEQLLHVDIFFSNYYNLKSVHFELKWMVGGQVNPIISIIIDNINNNNNNNNSNNNNNNNEKILLTTMLTIKILFTINSLEKKKKYSFKTLFTIPVDLKST